jgi:hypothetical protein
MSSATGVAARTRKIEVDLRVEFADFDSVESFTVLDMDGRFDLILGMPWLERHEPWIDWRAKSIGSSSPRRSEVQARHEPSFAHHQVNSITSDGTSMYFVGVAHSVRRTAVRMLRSLQASSQLSLLRVYRMRSVRPLRKSHWVEVLRLLRSLGPAPSHPWPTSPSPRT